MYFKAAIIAILPFSVLVQSSAISSEVDTSSRGKPKFVKTLNQHIFDPPASWASWRSVYHRVVELDDGSLLSSWENYAPEPPLEAAPIWKSTDGGKTYRNFSQVTDTVNGWGMRYQPDFLVLKHNFAHLKKGDILFAGNSVPSNLSSTKIDLYYSTAESSGKHWEFLSSVATGGAASASNGPTPIWEPFLYVYKDQLVCYYSDQGDPKHGQKLTHKTTKNLKKWTASVDDVADPDPAGRPGMTTMVQIGNGDYILTYEWCGRPSSLPNCQVFYKLASNPLEFARAKSIPLIADDGKVVEASPYVTWVPNGGRNGTIIVNGASDPFIWTNTGRGLPGTPWVRYDVKTDQAHSRTLQLLSDRDSLIIAGAGLFQAGPIPNNVTFSIVSLKSIIGD